MRTSFVFGLTALGLAVLSATFVGCAAGSDDPRGEGNDHDDQASNAVVENVYTVDGWMSLEDEYVPRVCTQENGGAPAEALKAQAIAARTYLLRAMRDDPSLGTTANPIGNGQSFQTYAAQANAGCTSATSATRGVVGQYQGALVIANYVAGALWSNGQETANDPTSTEHWVTYNDGLSGSAVHPTALSLKSRSDNRGCMSQNGSAALADAGESYDSILRYFYGADLELTAIDDMQDPSTDPDPTSTDDPSSSDTDTGSGGSWPTSTWSSSSYSSSSYGSTSSYSSSTTTPSSSSSSWWW